MLCQFNLMIRWIVQLECLDALSVVYKKLNTGLTSLMGGLLTWSDTNRPQDDAVVPAEWQTLDSAQHSVMNLFPSKYPHSEVCSSYFLQRLHVRLHTHETTNQSLSCLIKPMKKSLTSRKYFFQQIQYSLPPVTLLYTFLDQYTLWGTFEYLCYSTNPNF